MARSRVAALVGALAARRALRAATAFAPERTNYRGRPVSLAGGPALVAGATAGAVLGAGSGRAAAAAAAAGAGAGTVGWYDDLVGGRPEQAAKGFRGHLAALRSGRVTAGAVKVAGVGASGLVAAALLGSSRRGRVARGADVLLGAGVVAGMANLVNLLDLRPGRALKAGLVLGVPLAARSGVAAGTVGAAAALLPADLDERIMLGDAGANALGALLGTALAARTGPVARAALLAGLAALTAASERVSFTQVIARTPVLRELDALGRRRDERAVAGKGGGYRPDGC